MLSNQDSSDSGGNARIVVGDWLLSVPDKPEARASESSADPSDVNLSLALRACMVASAEEFAELAIHEKLSVARRERLVNPGQSRLTVLGQFVTLAGVAN